MVSEIQQVMFFLLVFRLQTYSTASILFLRTIPGTIKSPDDVVIGTKFAAYPWRLTSGQFVSACKYSPDLFVSCIPTKFTLFSTDFRQNIWTCRLARMLCELLSKN